MPKPSHAQSRDPVKVEMGRLREIEHLAWHVCESSEEDVAAGRITVDAKDLKALAAALPMEHPPHGFLPNGAKRDK